MNAVWGLGWQGMGRVVESLSVVAQSPHHMLVLEF